MQSINLPYNCGDYVCDSPPEHYSIYGFDRPRYGQLTSLGPRDRPAVHLMADIWNTVMAKMFTRQDKELEGVRLTDSASKYLDDAQRGGRTYRTISSTRHCAMVLFPSNAEHTVTSLTRECTCTDYQDNLLPCKHAMIVCRHHHIEAEEYISNKYFISAYRNTYDQAFAMEPIRVMDLESTEDCTEGLHRWHSLHGL